MRSGLVISGVLFLVIGLLLYFVPNQQLSARTVATDNGGTDVRTSSALFNIPIQWSYAMMLAGLLLMIIGLATPGPRTVVVDKSRDGGSYRSVETEEDVETDGMNGRRKRIVREHRERRVSREV